MTRAEHLAWCKQRALEYVDRGDTANAVASMISDLGKHEETQRHMGIELGIMLEMGGQLSSQRDVRDWIEGCN